MTLRSLKIKLGLLVSTLLFLGPVSAAAEEFVKGKHYEEIRPPLSTSAPSGQVEVLEFFWYGCPHCFEFEGHIAKWIKAQKDYISFARVPAVFSDTWFTHAKAFYAAAELGILPKSHFALFEILHVKSEKVYTEEAVINFLTDFDLEEQDVREKFNSFATTNRAKKAEALTKKAGLSGVPSVVINGKYRSSARLAGGYDKLLELITFLAEKEHIEAP